MTTEVDIRDLSERFAELIAEARRGDEIIVTQMGKPKAILLPLHDSKPRIAGLHAGAIQAGPDFDAPLPDEFWTGRP